MSQGYYDPGYGGAGGEGNYYDNSYEGNYDDSYNNNYGYGDGANQNQHYGYNDGNDGNWTQNNNYNDDNGAQHQQYQAYQHQEQYNEEENPTREWNEGAANDVYYSYSGNEEYQSNPYDTSGNFANNDNYYSGDTQQHQQQYEEHETDPSSSSLFYPSRPPFVAHPTGERDDYGNYNTRGDPISALAVDTAGSENEETSILYVASHTSHQGDGKHSMGSRSAGNRLGGANSKKNDPTLVRGSRMTVLYDSENASEFGNRSVYSSFVAHPEAEGGLLDSLYNVMFGGGGGNAVNSTINNTFSMKASHAYGPPFGPPSSIVGSARNSDIGNPYSRYHPSSHQHRNMPENKHCMGITSILPFASPFFGYCGSRGDRREGRSESRICTISPHGVRIHTRGGMIMSEKCESLSGMVCGVLLGGGGGGELGGSAQRGSTPHFATVGGISLKDETGLPSSASNPPRRYHHVHQIDLHRDLKIVSSHTLVRHSGGSKGSGDGADYGGSDSGLLCVNDMAANHHRSNIVVGCSDGTIRVLDGGRRQAEVAKAQAQNGGVAHVAVCENLICATGYTKSGTPSAASPLPYPFPAQHVLVFDIRYLGRGGFPHMFSANRGGPRFANFLPGNCISEEGDGQPRLLVGSGQTFGGFEIITPFQPSGSLTYFFQPALNAGESMSNVSFYDGELFIGTSHGRVLQHALANYKKTIHSTYEHGFGVGGARGRGNSINSSVSGDSFGGGTNEIKTSSSINDPLEIPPFIPAPPELSIDPTILCSSSQPDPRHFQGWNVFNSYVMVARPVLSEDGQLFHPRYARWKVNATSLGAMNKPMVPSSKRWLSKNLQSKLDDSASNINGEGCRNDSSKSDADYFQVFPTQKLNMTDLLESNNEEFGEGGQLKGAGESKHAPREYKKSIRFSNPNKLLYSAKPFAACYDALADPRKKILDSQGEEINDEEMFIQNEERLPHRYRLMVRPPFYKVTNFDYTRYNDTGIWVGWDYAPTFANSCLCAVLSLLYFIPEIRAAALESQLLSKEMSIQRSSRESSISITAELGLLFHLIENLSAQGMIHPDFENRGSNIGQVKAFVPSNIISAFSLLPEATNLALLDDVAGSVEVARRPESFYRFIVQYLDREQNQFFAINSKNDVKQNQGHLIDTLQGISFLSVIEYASGKAKVSKSRALTLDLAYKQKLSGKESLKDVRFGCILRYSLCREAPLRAWCEDSNSYESVIQRKIATSLPTLLSLSCGCAGASGDKLGLQCWQQENIKNWLPEFIEIQINADRSISVNEKVGVNEEGEEEWLSFSQKLSKIALPSNSSEEEPNLPIKKKYRLDAVVSFCSSLDDTKPNDNQGHHVIHVRSPMDLEIDMLRRQLSKIEECISENESNLSPKATQQLTLTSNISLDTLCERHRIVKEKIEAMKQKSKGAGDPGNQWLLINGFVVSKTSLEDARSFNVKFKEPSIVLYREIDNHEENERSRDRQQEITVPTSVMETLSLSHASSFKYSSFMPSNLPGKGDLVAIDAEFVCVQPEESMITPSGSKEITSESRNSLARLSMIDCKSNTVIVDDYILPREPVTDYLTRFSGIRKNDLDINSSPHHLVTIQEAYLKVRLLVERGCLFVGHGLNQDFRVINISVPPNQIIDTAEIFHQPNKRYISLRYLTNYVLGRDMQQEVHDSIEDARAAYELFARASRLKVEGKLNEFISVLYVHGHKTQFKLGLSDVEKKE